MKPAPRLCVICGARVRNLNPRTVTCSPVCTRARNARLGVNPEPGKTHPDAVSRGTMTPRYEVL